MIIEIHQPELEAWLQQRDVEQLLMQAMRSAAVEPETMQPVKQNLADFLLQSPLAGSGLDLVAAMQASPAKDICLEPSRMTFPVRDVSF